MTSPAAEAQPRRYLIPPVALTIEIRQPDRRHADVVVSAASGDHTFMRRQVHVEYDLCDSIDATVEAGLYRWVAWFLGYERDRRQPPGTSKTRTWATAPAWPAPVDVAVRKERASGTRRTKRTDMLAPDPDPF